MSCNKDKMPWEPWEDETISRLYPVGGSSAVARVLTHRKPGSIQKRASLINVSYGRRASIHEPNWEVPAHDYCEADLALRDWRGVVLPVVGTFAPGLGMRMAA